MIHQEPSYPAHAGDVAQASIGRDGGTTVQSTDLGEALDEMLFGSGKLNIKLLGGARDMIGG